MKNIDDGNSNKVSIIVTVYNNPIQKLERCLSSLSSQTYTNREIILVDDGSSELYRGLLFDLLDSYPEIIYINKINGGVSSARNYGLYHSNSSMVCFIDPDDEYDISKLSIQVPLLLQDEELCAVAGSSITNFISKRTTYQRKVPVNVYGYSFPLILENFFGIHGTPNYLFRTKCLIEIGAYNEQLYNNEDRELLYRLSKKYPIRTHKDIVCFVNKDDASESHNLNPVKLKSLMLFYKKVLTDDSLSDHRIKNYYLSKYILICVLQTHSFEDFLHSLDGIDTRSFSYFSNKKIVRQFISKSMLSYLGPLVFKIYRFKNRNLIRFLSKS